MLLLRCNFVVTLRALMLSFRFDVVVTLQFCCYVACVDVTLRALMLRCVR